VSVALDGTPSHSYECHLQYGITQCYMTHENTPRYNPSQRGWYSI